MKRLFNLSLADVKTLLHRFHELDQDGDGQLSLADFTVALKLQDADAAYTRKLFDFFDTADYGSISFGDLIQAR